MSTYGLKEVRVTRGCRLRALVSLFLLAPSHPPWLCACTPARGPS